MNIGATLIQITNLVLLLRNSNDDTRKFVVWQETDNKQTEVLTGLEVINANVEDSAQLFEHPIESGAVIVDHMIFNLKRVSILALISLDDRTTLEELMNFYRNGTGLTIRAENQIIKNAIVENKPFKLDAQYFNKTPYTISFKEAPEVIPTYVGLPKSRNKSNSSRVNSGTKQAQPVQNRSVLAGSYDAITGRR